MAKVYLTDIDLSDNQLLRPVLEQLPSAPADPRPGRIYFDTALSAPRVWSGAAWITLGAAAGAPAGPAAVPPYVQSTPATVWTIVHNLDRYPGYVVVDSAGNSIVPDDNYPDRNTLVLTFSVPTSGTVELDQR